MAASACLVTVLTGCLGAPRSAEIDTSTRMIPEGAIEIRMSQTSAADGAIGLSVEHFAELIHERTDGRYYVSTFHNGQLGSERDNIEGCQLGTIDMAVVNQSPLGNFVPEISAVDLPYVIQSYEHADKVFLGEIGENFLDQLDDVRIHGLTIWESGFRNLTNSKVKIETHYRKMLMEEPLPIALGTSCPFPDISPSWNLRSRYQYKNCLQSAYQFAGCRPL